MLQSFSLVCRMAFVLICLCGATAVKGQVSLSARFIDTAQSQRTPLPGVNVSFYRGDDSIPSYTGSSGTNGLLKIDNITEGRYRITASYIGYKFYQTYATVAGQDVALGAIILEKEIEKLAGAKIKAQGTTQQKGDTTVFNATQFKTNPDATAEDLVTKMPGMTNENGKVKAQGEEVKRVYVDGQEFFGDDATLALKNLPADVVDKVQVFDRMSDQSQFTGFNDGNTEKSINIVTKSGKSNGQFGKVYAGYGTDDRYMAGGNVNLFKGSRKISVLALSNNINQQNFSSQDLLGVSAASPGGGFGGPGGGGGGPRGGAGGGGSNNFLTGNQNGINTTNSYGFNYSNKLGKKINLSGSYFLNHTNNETGSNVHRKYFLQNGETQDYYESKTAGSKNMNHRFSLRFEYNIDTSNSLLITPRLNLQSNDATSLTSAYNMLADSNQLLNRTNTTNRSDNSGYSFSNNILFRHKFATARRTLSLSFSTDLNDKSGNSMLYSKTETFGLQDSTSLYDQKTNTSSDGYNLSPNITYTEPVGKKGMLQFTYNPSYAKSHSEKETRNIDNVTNEYSRTDTALSSRFENEVNTQKGGLAYRYTNQKFNFNIGANYQVVSLNSSQQFPKAFSVQKNFENVLPNAMMQYSFSKTNTLRVFYRASTNVPNISQLQSVINNNNPLLLSTGNPNLKQEYSHGLFSRYNLTQVSKSRNFSVFVAGTYTNNYIGNSTIIASSDSVLQEGVTLYKGSQLSKPVNLNGYWNLRTFGSYGFPVRPIKSNLNINAGFTYGRTPGSINGNINLANTYNMNTGFTLGSNISEKIDFKIAYAANYNIVENSIQPSLNNNYFFHNSSVKLNLMPWKGLVINADVTNTQYFGLGSSFNQNITLVNAGIGYKFLKNRAGELKLFTYDLLNQNKSITRTVTETYVEDNATIVLRRYFMLSFTYTFRYFKTPSKG